MHVELQASLGRFRFFKKLLALIHCCWTEEPLSNMYRTFLMSERSSLNFGWFRISGFGAQQSLHVGCSQQRQARAKFKSRSNSTSLLWAHVSYSFSCSSVTNSLMCLTEHQLILCLMRRGEFLYFPIIILQYSKHLSFSCPSVQSSSSMNKMPSLSLDKTQNMKLKLAFVPSVKKDKRS